MNWCSYAARGLTYYAMVSTPREISVLTGGLATRPNTHLPTSKILTVSKQNKTKQMEFFTLCGHSLVGVGLCQTEQKDMSKITSAHECSTAGKGRECRWKDVWGRPC